MIAVIAPADQPLTATMGKRVSSALVPVRGRVLLSESLVTGTLKPLLRWVHSKKAGIRPPCLISSGMPVPPAYPLLPMNMAVLLGSAIVRDVSATVHVPIPDSSPPDLPGAFLLDGDGEGPTSSWTGR